VPGSIGSDSHVDIAAKWRIPLIDGRQAFGLCQRRRHAFQSALPCLRHCFSRLSNDVDRIAVS
jgi:hypothetical protein